MNKQQNHVLYDVVSLNSNKQSKLQTTNMQVPGAEELYLFLSIIVYLFPYIVSDMW